MSRRLWREAYRYAREAAAETDRLARAARRTPRWRTFMLALGFPGFSRRWLARWEERHKEAMRKAHKETAHYIVEEHRGMRPGPQPAPRGMG